MNEEMSTTKIENVIWEEKNLTEQSKKLENNVVFVECDTIKNTKNLNVPDHLIDTTKEKISGIYKIINKVNQHYYVGSSSFIKRRWRDHKYELNKDKHDNSHLQRAWNKYGKNNFEFIIIEFVEESQLFIVEQTYLDIAKLEKDVSYNMNFIAECKNMTGINHPNYKLVNENVINEAKQLWLYKTSAEFVKYMNSNGFGQKVIKRILKDFKQDENLLLIKSKTYSKNMSNSVSGEKNGRWNKPASQETKLKMSFGRRNKTIHIFKNKITNEIFTGNQCEFYTKYNLTRTNVTNIIKGNALSHKNWILVE